MAYILDVELDKLVKAEIVSPLKKEVPLKKNGWKFNWVQLHKEKDSLVFVLKTIGSKQTVEGAIHLKVENEMLIMNALEIAPHNIGVKNKKYDYAAGCLIAFACKESFKLESSVKLSIIRRIILYL